MLDGFRNEKQSMRVIGAERPNIEWNESDETSDLVPGSIVATLTSTLFDDINMLVMDIFSRSMTTLKFEDFCTDASLGTLITGNLCLKNQNTESSYVNKEASTTNINAEANALMIKVSEISLS